MSNAPWTATAWKSPFSMKLEDWVFRNFYFLPIFQLSFYFFFLLKQWASLLTLAEYYPAGNLWMHFLWWEKVLRNNLKLKQNFIKTFFFYEKSIIFAYAVPNLSSLEYLTLKLTVRTAANIYNLIVRYWTSLTKEVYKNWKWKAI